MFPLSESIERAKRLVSDQVGIIAKVDFEELVPGEPSVFFSHSEPANASAISGQKSLNHGDAASVHPERAIMKAVGESVERYSSGQYDTAELKRSTFADLNEEAVDPEKFALYSRQQYAQENFPFSALTKKSTLRWEQGHSLRDEKPVWVPAAFVYVPYEFDAPNELPFFNPISTGLACGPNRSFALYKSILEVIERDAFMIVWKNQLPRPQLDIKSSKNEFVHQLLQALINLPLECKAIYLTLDIEVPVIAVAIHTTNDAPPYTAMGIGADLDPDRALIQALEEAYLTFLGMSRYAKLKKDYVPEPDYSDIKTPTLHALAHAICPELRSSFDFLADSKNMISLQDVNKSVHKNTLDNVRTLVKLLAEKGLDTISFDLTTLDIDEAGFKVVRSVIPGMEPLDINHSRRYLGGKRLYEVPVNMGLFKTPRSQQDLNPNPHPFP